MGRHDHGRDKAAGNEIQRGEPGRGGETHSVGDGYTTSKERPRETRNSNHSKEGTNKKRIADRLIRGGVQKGRHSDRKGTRGGKKVERGGGKRPKDH